jgi:hypothetical protein
MENGNSCSFKVVMAVSCIVFFLFSGRMHASQSSEIQMQGGVRASGGSEGHEISIGEWVLAGNKKRYIGFSDGVVRRGFGFEISDGVRYLKRVKMILED